MNRGRPFELGNKFGRGRPKGSLNKSTQLAHKLFEEHSPTIMALAISQCRDDRQMLRMFVRHILPRQKDWPVKIGRMPVNTLEDLNQASAMTIKQVTAGRISVSEALGLSDIIENRRRVLETQDLDRRLSALEHGGELPNGSLPK
jgi:hypothetical protein